MTDKDRGRKPQPNEILPADEDFEEPEESEESEDFVEAEEEFEEEPQAAQPAAATAPVRRAGRTEEAPRRALGSVRVSHERVRVDDRLSAAFAILCAVALVGVLVLWMFRRELSIKLRDA